MSASNGTGQRQGLSWDWETVVDRLAQQVAALNVELAIRDGIIEKLRGELARAQEVGEDRDGFGDEPVVKRKVSTG